MATDSPRFHMSANKLEIKRLSCYVQFYHLYPHPEPRNGNIYYGHLEGMAVLLNCISLFNDLQLSAPFYTAPG